MAMGQQLMCSIDVICASCEFALCRVCRVCVSVRAADAVEEMFFSARWSRFNNTEE